MELEKGSTGRIYGVLRNVDHLKFTNIKANHVNRRRKWAEDHVTWEANPFKWKTVIHQENSHFLIISIITMIIIEAKI